MFLGHASDGVIPGKPAHSPCQCKLMFNTLFSFAPLRNLPWCKHFTTELITSPWVLVGFCFGARGNCKGK